MPKAYCLGEERLKEELVKLPWLNLPENLIEVLAICDEQGHPRHLRAYAAKGKGKQLFGPRALDADAVLALIKTARRHGDAYDLTTGFEIEVSQMIQQHGDLQKAYLIIRDHILMVIGVRLSARDPHGLRLDRLCEDIPELLADVKAEHEPCFAEFDAWHHVAILRDLARQRSDVDLPG